MIEGQGGVTSNTAVSGEQPIVRDVRRVDTHQGISEVVEAINRSFDGIGHRNVSTEQTPRASYRETWVDLMNA
jgi:hypothetical protein